MKRLALCIGNDDYQFINKLSCAISDARAIADKLKDLGFDTILEKNLDRESLAKVIYEAIDKIDEYDAFLVYYAGHGFQVSGTNILAPIDLNINDRDEVVAFNSFPLSLLTESLGNHPNTTKVIVLDACRTILGRRGSIKD